MKMVMVREGVGDLGGGEVVDLAGEEGLVSGNCTLLKCSCNSASLNVHSVL